MAESEYVTVREYEARHKETLDAVSAVVASVESAAESLKAHTLADAAMFGQVWRLLLGIAGGVLVIVGGVAANLIVTLLGK